MTRLLLLAMALCLATPATAQDKPRHYFKLFHPYTSDTYEIHAGGTPLSAIPDEVLSTQASYNRRKMVLCDNRGGRYERIDLFWSTVGQSAWARTQLSRAAGGEIGVFLLMLLGGSGVGLSIPLAAVNGGGSWLLPTLLISGGLMALAILPGIAAARAYGELYDRAAIYQAAYDYAAGQAALGQADFPGLAAVP